MLYLTVKSLHILSVVIFLGNVITGVLWKFHGDRGDARSRAQALDGIITTDRWFTMPGVVLIIITGIVLALLGNIPLLSTRWVLWSIILFGVSGLAFSFFVAPLQKKLRALAQAGINGAFDAAEYARLSRSWEIWGGVATLTPLAALFLMVIKPV